jgi:hypothetical protein
LTWIDGQYYVAFIAVILLARGLGPLFFVPLLLDLAFDVGLMTGVMSGWDYRLVIVVYEFGIFLWVLSLAGNLRKSTFVVMLLLDLVMVFKEMLPSIQATGTGQDFWNSTSTAILDVWQTSVIVVIGSMVVRSTIVAKLQGRYVDILTNPKKRFVLPIGAWALVQELPVYLKPWMPDWIMDARFPIAANVLVWGWVALELPFYLMYRRIKKQYS